METLIFIAVLVVLVPPVLAIISIVSVSNLKYRVQKLEADIESLQTAIASLVHERARWTEEAQTAQETQKEQEEERTERFDTAGVSVDAVNNVSPLTDAITPEERQEQTLTPLRAEPFAGSFEWPEGMHWTVPANKNAAQDSAKEALSTASMAELKPETVSSVIQPINTEPENVAMPSEDTVTDSSLPLSPEFAAPVSAVQTDTGRSDVGESPDLAGEKQTLPEQVVPEAPAGIWMQDLPENQEERPSPQPPVARDRAKEKPSLGAKAVNKLMEWFTTGNVPVKIGVLVLFAGVAALLKYVTDQGWLSFPMEFRLLGIAGLALGALGFAWRQRERQRTFSLSLQGGAIGILLLTVFAAFKLYGFLPASLAFGLTTALVVGTGLLAVMQDARILAVFAILAGFLSPIWLSTGSNNHVALFSYYAILNAGIFGMAWWRSWRMLNLLGFAFTFGIGTFWGALQYAPEKFASTEPFLLLFFAFYLVIPILYARSFVGNKRDMVDAALVFGTPLVAFSLQSVLLQDFPRYVLAANAFGLGVLYAVLARFLASGKAFKELVPAYIALAAGFMTLAVPLAFSAQQTSCIYALEGAALVWWGIRQARQITQYSGLALQVLAAGTLVYSMESYFMQNAAGLAVVNPTFVTLLMLAAAGLFCTWVYWANACGRLGEKDKYSRDKILLLYLWGLLWWCVAGWWQIKYVVDVTQSLHAGLMFAVLTAWLAAEARRKCKILLLPVTTMAGFVLVVMFCLMQTHAYGTPLTGYGWLAWAVYAVLAGRSIYCLRQDETQLVEKVQLLWWPTWALMLTLALKWWGVQSAVAADWVWAVQILPWVTLIVLTLWFWGIVRQPLGMRFDACRDQLQGLLFAAAGLWWLSVLMQPADSTPFIWLPVLNPIELLQLLFVGLLWYWLKKQNTQTWLLPLQQNMLFAVAGFLLTSVMTLRAVHHWAGVPWSEEIFAYQQAQTYLSMVWSVLGGVMVWRGVYKKQMPLQNAGIGLQLLAAIAFGLSLLKPIEPSDAILTPVFINMLLLAFAGLGSAWCYHTCAENKDVRERQAGIMFYVWGMLCWLVAGLYQIDRLVPESYVLSFVLVLVALTGWLAAEVHRVRPALLLGVTTMAGIGLAVPLALLQSSGGGYPFADGGWLGWLCYGIFGWRALLCLRQESIQWPAKAAQLIWWPVWMLVLGLVMQWWSVSLELGAGWQHAAIVLPWLLLAGATLWLWERVRLPLGVAFDASRRVLQSALFYVGVLWWLYALFLPAQTEPFIWLPVLNPLDAMQLCFAGMLIFWLRTDKSAQRFSGTTQVLMYSAMLFALASTMVLRGVHHWGGIPWDGALMHSTLAQTGLSVVWSVLGVLAWIRGSRRGLRELWWVGAILMGVVLAKLILVDRQNLGNVLGITSFIAYGLLCVVVGYLAPAPPREALQNDKEQ